jgi:hypothetical protein
MFPPLRNKIKPFRTFILLDSSSSTDYAKSLHLQTNRTLEFHNLDRLAYEVRLPRFGRDLAYVRQTTEALIPAVGLSADGSGFGEVFRLNCMSVPTLESLRQEVDRFSGAWYLYGPVPGRRRDRQFQFGVARRY